MELIKKKGTIYQKDSPTKSVLTTREVEYISLVALGYKNWMIAKVLFVSNSTVKKTLENISRKLNARDRANAVAIAFIHNLINAETLTQIIKSHDLIMTPTNYQYYC